MFEVVPRSFGAERVSYGGWRCFRVVGGLEGAWVQPPDSALGGESRAMYLVVGGCWKRWCSR